MLQDTIYEKFLGSLPAEEEIRLIKDVDDTCLYYEFEHYMGEQLAEEQPKRWSEMVFETRPFREVEEELHGMIEDYVRKQAKNDEKDTDSNVDL